MKVYDTKEQDWEFADDDYVSIIPAPCRWESWAHDKKDGKALTGDELLRFVNNILFPVLKGQDYKEGDEIVVAGIKVSSATPIKQAIVQTTFADANNYMKDGVLLRQLINVIDELDLSDYEESHAFGEIYESILKELQSAGSSGEFYTPRAVTDFMAQMIAPRIGEQMADFACGTGGFLTSWLKELEKQVKTTADELAYSNSIYGIEKKQFPYILCITNMLLHNLDVPRVYHANSLLHNVLDYTEDDRFDVILMNPPYGGSEKADVKSHFPSDLASSETADLFMSVIMYRLKQNGRAAVILPDGFMFGTDNAKVAIKKKMLNEFNLHTVIRLPGSVFAPYTSITTNILFFDKTQPTEKTWFYRMDMPEGYKHFSKTKPMKQEHFDKVREWWHNRQELEADGFPKAKCFSAQELADNLGYNLDQCGYPHEEEVVLAPAELIARYEEERASLNAEIVRVLEDIKNTLVSNSKELNIRYTNACGRLAEISMRFPSDMQKSLLQYAIEGKLVEQRAEEGTAEELFAQIQAEKQRLIAEGKLKKQKPLPEITEEEKPFDIPESWKWCYIGDIFAHNTGKALNRSEKEGVMLSYITTSNLYCNRFELDNIKEMLFQESEIEKCTVVQNDLLVCEGGDFGRAAIWTKKEPIRIQNHIHRLRPFFPICVKYFYYIFYLYKNTNRLVGKGIGIKGLSASVLHSIKFPLPPLAEQKRIVARLEELRPLCDRLKK